nr:hypothetical protein [Tanacetum cinerariifolium]GEZ35172.1 hypothetical protein [Tanacetum cinerariifolium]
MIAYLSKSDASKGFNQIIDFLNGSLIKYALTVNTNIYVSCIKQFWTTVAVKKVNDVTRLQALVDKKKMVVTKATIRDALRLDDAEGVECLLNEEIFAELARMGYEKSSTKLTFYKAFFSSQWKFVIHTILQCMSAKRTSWNEFSSSMASAVICLSTVQPTPPQSPQVQPQSPQPQPQHTQDAGLPMDLLHTLLDTCTTLTRKVENLETNKIAQALEIIKLKQWVKKLERRNKVKVLKLRRIIADMDQDVDVVLEEDKDVAADVKDVQDADIDESAHDQERQAES